MGKSVQAERIIEIPIDKLKDILSNQINEDNKFSIKNFIKESNGYVFMVKGAVSMKTFGENIILILESINEHTTKVCIKSECTLKTQIFDWNANQENIDKLFSIMVYFPDEENISNENNQSIKDKYLKTSNKNIWNNKEILKKHKSKRIESISCIYCGGHENISRECSGVVDVYYDRIEFRIIKKQFEIPISMITNNEIVTYDQVVQRLTATRIALFGIFAATAPKRKIISSNYLKIDFEEYGVKSTIVFRGDATFSIGSSSDLIVKLNSLILKERKEHAKNKF